MTAKALEKFITEAKHCVSNDDKALAVELLEVGIRIAESSLNAKPKRISGSFEVYGEYQNVKLSAEQLDRLKNDFGAALTEKYIDEVDAYCQQSRKAYKDYSVAIRNFLKRNGIRPVVKKQNPKECPF